MAVYKEDIVDIDLKTGTIFRSFTNKSIGEGDIKGDRFGVRVLRNGEEVDLTGVSVSGFFINANGETVEITGSTYTFRTGSKCGVILPAGCYAVDGNFTLIIKLTVSGVTTTARIVDGTVVNTVLDSILNPGSTIPSLADYETLVERAEAAASTIESFDISATIISGTRYRLSVTETT